MIAINPVIIWSILSAEDSEILVSMMITSAIIARRNTQMVKVMKMTMISDAFI